MLKYGQCALKDSHITRMIFRVSNFSNIALGHTFNLTFDYEIKKPLLKKTRISTESHDDIFFHLDQVRDHSLLFELRKSIMCKSCHITHITYQSS